LQDKLSVYERSIGVLGRLHARALGHDSSRQGFDRQGFDRQAFDDSERQRARSFLDTLAESRAQITKGLTPEQVKRQPRLASEASRAYSALLQENSERNRKSLEQAERDLSDWLIELRETSPQYRQLRYPEPLESRQVQALLKGTGTALVEYSLGAEGSYAWLVTETDLAMVALPKQAEIERLVRDYRKEMATRPQGEAAFIRHYGRSEELYRILVEPLRSRLAKVRKLVIIPDGILHYLPFETLLYRQSQASGRHYLIEDFTMAYAPSASVLASLMKGGPRQGSGSRELLAYGDPAFRHGQFANPSSAEAVRGSYESRGLNLSPLPGTRDEVNGIAGLFPPAKVRKYLGSNATEESLKQEDLAVYRRIHFATHAIIDERIPSRSSIVLSLVDAGGEDGILQMNEIFNLPLDAEVVVLSACQTGLGRLVKGEGMVGLTRAFFYAGAARLVVSLWAVNDQATSEFMKSFYRHMKGGATPAESLRDAKLEMLHSDAAAYRHPYFWAPFVMVGSL